MSALVVVCAAILSCTDGPTALMRTRLPGARSADVTSTTTPAVVISQIYGGGGNAGATLKNDFVELFNRSGQPVSVEGWSVQYASAAGNFGSSGNVTVLHGTIPAGAYYLVQEAAGTGGTTNLPTPDATGNIAMSATTGKVAVVIGTAALGVSCPAPTAVEDLVAFGGTASTGNTTTNCGNFTAPTLANTTAAIRTGAGCDNTQDMTVPFPTTGQVARTDFTSGAAAPRNSQTPVNLCPGTIPVGPLTHVALTGPATLNTGASVKLVATPQDANNQTVSTATIAWSTSDATIATVDATGNVTAVAASTTPVTITATATDGSITESASVQITVQSPAIHFISISSSSPSVLPGFQSQLFVSALTAQTGGVVVPATFTFDAVNPELATVATVRGETFVTGVAAPADGTTRPGFRIIATPKDGATPPDTFVTHAISIDIPNPAPLSIYVKNDEFGDPAPAGTDPNNFLITRPQYTISYNQSRGTPNWVSYELDARDIVVGQDRCNCFSADPLLPADKQVFTSDYTNGGFDRGHMTRSADRTAGNTDNAATFYLTNVVPQTADLNEGVWAQFEDALADSAEAGRAVYIISGPLYTSATPATLKDSGRVAIPDATWKVALIGPRVAGAPFTRANIQTWADLAGTTLLAVNMPNISGVRNDPWQKYLTTVDKIEAATGYDFLSLLPTMFQNAIEAGDRSPVAKFAVSGTANEGSPLTFDASASTDPDLGRTDLDRTEALTYTWYFSDGTSASGVTGTHTFADNGTYTAALTVTDAFGWQSIASQTVTVANVAPTVSFKALSPLVIQSGDPVATEGTFTDPGPDAPWTASIDWGNGTVNKPLPSSFSKSGAKMLGGVIYVAPGSYTATLSVTDKDGGIGSATLAVTVSRRALRGEVNGGGQIKLSGNGDPNVDLLVYGDLIANMRNLDASSVRIAGVAPTDANLEQDSRRIRLRFSRQALLAAGAIAAGTTSVELTGALTNGIQIVSEVPVSVSSK